MRTQCGITRRFLGGLKIILFHSARPTVRNDLEIGQYNAFRESKFEKIYVLVQCSVETKDGVLTIANQF